MTFLGVVGVLIGLLALPWAFVHATRVRVAIFFVAFVMHVIAAFIYHDYTLSAPADSHMYYDDPFHFFDAGFGLSTQFIVWFVQVSKSLVGGTYLDYFLLFQAFGFFGLVILMRILEETFEELGVQQPLIAYAFLFLPGLHFWTSSIGKDGLLFTAVCLSLWSIMNPGRRFLQLCVALAMMLLVRPHIALVAMIALALTFLLDRRTRPAYRLMLLALSLVGVAFAIATLRNTFAIDVTDADSVSDFMAQREAVVEDVDAGNTMVNSSLPVRFLSLLFRPLFFDAQGMFAYVASLESVVTLAAVAYLLFNLRGASKLARSVSFLRFAFAFTTGVTIILALTYFNVGLGLRQRAMILPGILVLVSSLYAFQRARAFLHTVPPAKEVSLSRSMPAEVQGPLPGTGR